MTVTLTMYPSPIQFSGIGGLASPVYRWLAPILVLGMGGLAYVNSLRWYIAPAYGVSLQVGRVQADGYMMTLREQ